MKRDANNRITGQRFEQPARLRPAAAIDSRWSDWSKSIVDRRLRTALPRFAATLTLVERSSSILNIFQQWDLRAWRIAQHHRLSAGPVIPTVERNLKQPFSHAPQPGLPVSQRYARNEPSRSAGIEQVVRPEGGLLLSSPLQRGQTFRRGEPDDEFERTLSLRMALSLTRRLVEERRRIEQPARRESSTLRREGEPSTPGLTRMPTSSTITLDRSPGRAPMVLNLPSRKEPAVEQSFSASMKRHGVVDREPSFMAPPAPQINIEQITDHVIKQIDHRIVAFRERMGRPGI